MTLLTKNELSVLGYILRHLMIFDSEINKKQLEYLGILNNKYKLTPELLHSDNLNNLEKVQSIIKEMSFGSRSELITIISELILIRDEPNDNQINMAMKFIGLIKESKFAVIIDKGETLSGMQGNRIFSWKNDEIMNNAGIETWSKSNFYPKNGDVGEIVDLFSNPIFDFKIYVLLIENEFYVPISEKGIKMI